MDNETLSQLEKGLAELKTLYENYFAGLERREPLRRREKITRTIHQLAGQAPQNTQLAFRLNNLKARFGSFETYWNRVVRQIEEGTYKREKLKAKRILEGEVPLVSGGPPHAPPVDPLGDSALREVYAKYAAARKQNGEPPVSYEAMVNSLKKQVPSILDRYQCKTVEFRVASGNGKAQLKATPIF